MRAIGLVGILLVVTFAGCVQPSSPEIVAPTSEMHFRLVDFEGCTGTAVFAFPDFAATAPFLPPGYKAADASEFFENGFNVGFGLGLPPIGQAMMALIFTQCHVTSTDKMEELLVSWIFIDDPGKPWENGTADLHFYEMGRYASEELIASLADVHWHGTPSELEKFPLLETAGAISTQWTLGSSSAPIMNISHVAAGAPIDATGLYRTWNEHEDGTTMYEFHVNATLLAGVGRCTADQNHWVSQFIGGECAGDPTNPLLYAAFSGLELKGRFIHERH